MDRIEELLRRAKDISHEFYIDVKMGEALAEVFVGPGAWRGKADLDEYEDTTEAVCDALEEALADIPNTKVITIKHKWPLTDNKIKEGWKPPGPTEVRRDCPKCEQDHVKTAGAYVEYRAEEWQGGEYVHGAMKHIEDYGLIGPVRHECLSCGHVWEEINDDG
jgi:hypothetical protein